MLIKRTAGNAQVINDYDTHPELIPSRCTFINKDCHNKLNAETISKLWGIGLQRAEDTIKATMQEGVRSAVLPLSRRYRSDRMYKPKRLRVKMQPILFTFRKN